MIRAETFLALEESLSHRLQVGFTKLTSKLFKEVETAMEVGDFEKAVQLAQSFSLQPLVQENEKYIEYITNMAMLFGASRVTRTPGTTRVGLGFEKNTSYQMVLFMKQMITANAEELLKRQALQLIAMHRDEATAQKSEVVQKAKKRILQPFGTFMDSAGRAAFNLASSLHTSRVSSYGFTAEANALGITEYQINEQLDARTCPVCREMHGKKFQVADARGFLDMVVRATDPDDLRQLQPWPPQNKDNLDRIREMDPEELVMMGWHVPPFHPRCRGLLARVGKVPSLAQIEQGLTDERLSSTASDFMAVGVTASQKQVSRWNALIKTTPDTFLAALVKQSSDAFMKSIFEGKTGVTLAMYEGYAKMKLFGSFYGVEGMTLGVTLGADYLTAATASLLNQASATDFVKGAYLAAVDAGVSTLKIPRVSLLSSLASKGFTIEGSLWVLDLKNPSAVAKLLG